MKYEDSAKQTNSLYEEFLTLKPEFNDKASARAAFVRELESLAAQKNKTIDQLVHDAESSNRWDEQQREVMRLSRLIFVLDSMS